MMIDGRLSLLIIFALLLPIGPEGFETTMDSAFRLSVAIPVHNEESMLPELLRRTCTALDQVPRGRHEIVFVDDGTTDQTFAILEEAARRDSRICSRLTFA